MGKLLNASPKLCTGRGGQSTWRPAVPATGVAGDELPHEEHRRGPPEQASTTTWIWPHLRGNTSPAGGPGGHCRYTQTGVPSPTRQGRRRSGVATTDHGPGPPRTGPEPPRAGPGPLQVEAGPPAGLSLRSQPRGPDPAPYSGRGPEPSQAPVGVAADPRVRRRHVSHRADLRPSAPRLGRGPEPPRAPVGAAADPRVRCRHVSHRRESST